MIRTVTVVAFGAGTLLLTSAPLAQPLPPPPHPASPPSAPKTTASAPASPEEEASAGGAGWSAALLLGDGFDDALKVGLGVRAGYTLPVNVYLGGTFIYHLGSTRETNILTTTYSVSEKVFQPGVEAGYDLSLGGAVFRPYLGIGLALLHVSDNAGQSNTESHVAFWPGATLLYPVAPGFALGADVRLLLVNEHDAFETFGTAQLHF